VNTPEFLRIAPERKVPVRFHAQIANWSFRSGAILRILAVAVNIGPFFEAFSSCEGCS
jgi:hypothetical protein